MDKLWKGQPKPSLHLSKPKLPEHTSSKIKSKDFTNKQKDSNSREDINILPREIEIQKSLQNIDLNVKIDDLTTEINVLKEKLTDINLSNIHLKNMLREKTPNKSVSQRVSHNITDPSMIQPQYKQMKPIDKTTRQTMPPNEIHFIPYPQAQRMNYLTSNTHSNIDEIKEKDKQIEQLKDKSKQLESLVVTLENKLDKSNTLLPDVISKAKEYHRLYDETRRENEKIKSQSKSSSNVNTIGDYCSNQPMKGPIMRIEDSKENDHMHRDLRKQIETLNKTLREEKEQAKVQIEEMKSEITRLTAVKKESDKQGRDIIKLKEENEQNLRDLTERSTKIYNMTNELNDLKTLTQKNEKDYKAQISKLINEKEQILTDKNKIQNDYNKLTTKANNDSNELIILIKANHDLLNKNDSLSKALSLKVDEITHANNTINKIEIEKKKLQLEIDQLNNDKQIHERTLSNDTQKIIKEKEDLESEKQKMKIQLEVYQLEQKDKSNESTKQKKDNELLKQYIIELKEDISRLQKENQNQTSLQVSNLKTQLNQSEEKHKQLIIEKDMELKTLTASYGNKDEEVTQLKKIIKEKMYENDAMKEELKEKEKMKQMIEVYDKKIKEFSKANQALYSDVSKLKTLNENKEKEIIQLSGLINALKDEIKEKEESMLNLNEANEEFLMKYNDKIKAKDEELNKCLMIIKERDEEIKGYSNSIKEIDIKRQEKDIKIKEQEMIIRDNESVFKQKEKIIHELGKTVKELDNQVILKDELICQQDQMIQERNEIIKDKDNTINSLSNEELMQKQSSNNLINEKMNTIDQLAKENMILNKQIEVLQKQITQHQSDMNINSNLLLKKYNLSNEKIDMMINDGSITKYEYPSDMSGPSKLSIENIILSKRLEKSFNEISQLNHQLTNEHNNLNQQTNTNTELIVQLTNDNQALQKELSTLKAAKALEEPLKASLIKEKEDLTNQLNTLRESYDVLEKNQSLILEELDKEKEETEKKHKEEITSNEKSKSDLIKKNEDYLRKISELKSMIETKNHNIVEQKKLIEKKEMEINEIQRQNENMTTDMLSSQSKVTEMTMKIKRMQSLSEHNEESKNEEVNQLKTSLKEKEERVLEIQKELGEKDKLLQSKDDIIALLDKEVIQYKEMALKSKEDQETNEIKGKENDEGLQLKLDELTQQLMTLNAIKEAYEAKTKEASQLLKEKTNLELESTNTINTLKSTNDELNNLIKSLNATITDKEQAITKDNERINKHQEELIIKDKEITQLKQSFEEDKIKLSELYDKQFNNCNEQLKQLNFIIEQRDNEIFSLKRQNQLNQKELNTLHISHKDNKGIMQTLNDEIQRQKLLIDQMDQLDKNLREEKTSNATLRQSLKELEADNQSKNNQVISLKEDIESLTARLEDGTETTKDRLAKLQVENEELKGQMRFLIEESTNNEVAMRMAQDTRVNESQSENEHYKAKIFNLEHELASHKEIINSQSESLKQLKTQCEDYKSQYNSSLQQIDDSKQKESIAMDEIQKMKDNDSEQKMELEKLTAQIFILTTNSANFTSEVEKRSEEIQRKLYQKEQENSQLNNSMANLKIEHKALKEEYDAMTSEIVLLKESLIKKEIELKENEESHQKDIEEIAKIRDEYQDLTNKLLKIEALPDEVTKLQDLLDEKTMELSKHQEMIDKLIHINQEMSEKVNQKSTQSLDSKQFQQMTNTIEGADDFDKDDFISLQMKNDSLNELIKSKEDEIKTLKAELDVYKSEIAKVMNEEAGESVNSKGKGPTSLLTNSPNQSEDITKVQEVLSRTKKAYKDKSNEVSTLQQQLSLLKGDIRNYQMKIETMEKDSCPIKNYEEFKGKLKSVLENYKPKKKEQIDIVKEIRSEIGDDIDEKSKTPDSQGEKKKGFFNFSKK